MKKYFKSLIFSFIFLLIGLSLLSVNSFAARTEGQDCDPSYEKCETGLFCVNYTCMTAEDAAKVSAATTSNTSTISSCDAVMAAFNTTNEINLWRIDIGSTLSNASTAVVLDVFGKVMGANATDVIGCEGYISKGKSLGFAGMPVCTPKDATKCQEYLSSQQMGMRYEGKPTKLLSIDGSLWGISGQLENVNKRDPVALNLAYYWNDQIAHIPFVNKALAADSYSNTPILASTLSIWKLARNVSLGLISIVLMYTGLMIIMRKKVNAQLVVSVQYAIPKIMVGLVLIIFSFPIGAAITGLSWGLFRGADNLVSNLALTEGLADLSGTAILSIIIATLKYSIAGLVFLVVSVVITVVLLILKIAVEIKAIMIYMKMVLSTVIAPFEFALGTVPGNEDSIKNWFLRMAKYAISVFAMGLVIPVSLTVALNLVNYYHTMNPGMNTSNYEVAGFGSLLTIAIPIMIVIFGFSMALSMETTIDKMFFGGGKKK